MSRKHFYGEDHLASIQIFANDGCGAGEVEVVGDLSALESLSPDEADRIADALKQAASAARDMRTILDRFLEGRRER